MRRPRRASSPSRTCTKVFQRSQLKRWAVAKDLNDPSAFLQLAPLPWEATLRIPRERHRNHCPREAELLKPMGLIGT